MTPVLPNSGEAAEVYAIGTHLRHHGGSLWEVTGCNESTGDYGIKCLVGTAKPGRIGGEVTGTVRSQVHADYLHGDGWRVDDPDGDWRDPFALLRRILGYYPEPPSRGLMADVEMCLAEPRPSTRGGG